MRELRASDPFDGRMPTIGIRSGASGGRIGVRSR